MLKVKGRPNHECCPPEWRDTPNIVGDYDFDGGLVRNKNTDLPARLKLYLTGGDQVYGQVTGYNGYDNYHGDS